MALAKMNRPCVDYYKVLDQRRSLSKQSSVNHWAEVQSLMWNFKWFEYVFKTIPNDTKVIFFETNIITWRNMQYQVFVSVLHNDRKKYHVNTICQSFYLMLIKCVNPSISCWYNVSIHLSHADTMCLSFNLMLIHYVYLATLIVLSLQTF